MGRPKTEPQHRTNDMVQWRDERLNRMRFGTVVQVGHDDVLRIRLGDNKIVSVPGDQVQNFSAAEGH